MAASGGASGAQATTTPAFPELLGHPRPLWMLFMTEFWERFSFYGMRWALTLYIVAQFYGGSGTGEAPANRIYGAYLALVYASGLLGGYAADRLIGYQRSILLGAAIMGAGLFVMMIPTIDLFEIGLALVIVGNGLLKPNISTMVGQLYSQQDPRRDAGFTIFYMGINLGSFFSPLLTGWFASVLTDTPLQQNYKVVFASAGVGMILSFLWFWFGRRQLREVGRPPGGSAQGRNIAIVLVGAAVLVPIVYVLLAKLGADVLAWVLAIMFIALAAMLLVEGVREGPVARDRVIAMLIIFAFSIMFWMFYEQAGSSFNFLADKIVDRRFGNWEFPVAWFQSVNPIGIIVLAPIVAAIWVWLGKRRIEPSIPRKFGLGLVGNGVAFLLLMYALTHLIDGQGKIPFWTLFMVYIIQAVGELFLSPIGLSMVTKLAPMRLVGFAMGGWFLSTAIGDNLSGIFASVVSGETGMTTASALSGYTFGWWALAIPGVLLLLIAPLINRLMHGVK